MTTDADVVQVIRSCQTFAIAADTLGVSRKAVEQRVRKLRDEGYGDRLPEFVDKWFVCECCGRKSRSRHAPTGFCWRCFVKTAKDLDF